MPKLNRTQLTYPARGQAQHFEILKRFYEGFDNILYAHREDRNVILFGGGVLSWAATAGELSFTADILLLSPQRAYHEVITQATYNPITINDGQLMYVELTRSPSATISLVPRVANVLPQNDNAFMIAFRDADVVYIRNGRGFGDGDTGPIYNSAADDPISGFTRDQITIQTDDDDWIGGGGVTDSADLQTNLSAGFSSALMAPDSVDVFYNNLVCHYTSGVPGSINEWTWVTSGSPTPAVQIGAGSLAGDIVTVKYPR